MIQNELYLAHHGRLGQKWGKKNGPPYPLDYNKLSSEEREKAKVSAIKRGDVKEVSKNREYYSNQEINDAINRFNINQKLSEVSTDKVKTGREKAEDMVKTLGTITNVVSKGSDAYNAIAKVANAIGGTDLPIIGEKKDLKKVKKEISESFKDGKLVSKTVKTDDGTTTHTKKYESSSDKKISYTSKDYEKILKNIDAYSDEEISKMASRRKSINKLKSNSDKDD